MSNDNQLHSDATYKTSRVFFSPWIVVSWLLIVIFGAVFLLPALSRGEGSAVGRVVLVVALLFAAVITGSHHRLKISGDDIMVLSFPLFYKKIPLYSIASVSEGRMVNAFKDYGFGPKMRDGGWVICNRSGKSIEIRLHDGKQYMIVVPDERELSEAVALANRQIVQDAENAFPNGKPNKTETGPVYYNPDDDEMITHSGGMNIPNFANKDLWILVTFLAGYSALMFTLVRLAG